MATVLEQTETLAPRMELHNGDRMPRQEFHRLYEKMPDDIKAELIGGIVYMASPLKRQHATSHPVLGTVFVVYQSRTPGVEAGDNATVLLGEESEPQPDLYLRILPEFGGQSRTEDDYVSGAPELIAEIAHSSRAIDLHAKMDDYARSGVLEYIVVCLQEGEVRWFDLKSGSELFARADGVFQSRVFPGLWVDKAALLSKDSSRLIEILEQGLSTTEHTEFARRLAEQKAARAV